MAEETAMDGNLLLSVLGGLGRVENSDDGIESYVKDDDCVGKQHDDDLQSCCSH